MGSQQSGPQRAVRLGVLRGVARGEVPGFWIKRLNLRRVWALPLLVLSSLLAVAAPAAATEELSREIRRNVVFGQRGWTVRWQARAFEQGGFYRLYVGRSQDSLRLVDVQHTVRGVGNYRYNDRLDGSARLYYQLRYVAPGGEELILGTLRLDLDGVGSIPASVWQERSDFKALHEEWSSLSLASTRLGEQPEAGLPKAESAQPEVPPPRPGV